MKLKCLNPLELDHHLFTKDFAKFLTRVRTKECFKCSNQKSVLYRCKYNEIKEWVFLCSECLKQIKNLFEDTYQYGGTWKSKKK